MAIEITLTPYEFEIALLIGSHRQKEAVRKGLKDQHGLEFGSKDPLVCHVEGVAGEMACAQALNVYWVPTVNTFKSPDLADDIQVKTRGRADYDLLVRPKDDVEHLFVLVTKEPANLVYRVHGWLTGADAKQQKYLQNYGGRAPAYFAPQAVLNPIEDLIEKVIIAQAERIGL